MQQRAGLIFLSKKTFKLLLILKDSSWTVPTFYRKGSLLEDATDLLDRFSVGKIIPIELYLSEDRGFEYGTYVCLVEEEFLPLTDDTFCWCSLTNLPPKLHKGLKATLSNQLIRAKIETIIELEKYDNKA